MSDDAETLELKPEAGGGGNRIRPPLTVTTGETPDDRQNNLHRKVTAMAREARRLELLLKSRLSGRSNID